MYNFVSGQRWISNAESQLGLGTIMSIEQRTISIHFPATDETRIYAKDTAPLTRIIFAAGDQIRSTDGTLLTVTSIHEDQGLLTYIGTDENNNEIAVFEGRLNSTIQLSRPTERLFNGQIDQDKWFELRYQTLQEFNRLSHSEVRGLAGVRTSLIPHQLYIAHEVANRYAPRVLLADEVGLGKTIEAGLIIHHQLLSERAQRILIIVPESLIHQWLVEMLRRFNLYFSLFDEERCRAIEEHAADENPFHTEQQVLCSLDFITAQPHRFQQVVAGEWDLLVVDEAHHLQWSTTRVSPEYQCIEQLAEKTKGVLLLTATPEQLGKASHYARLRLLDHDRFADFDAFIAEENSYQPIAHAIDALINQPTLDEQSLAMIRSTMGEGDNQILLENIEDNQGDQTAAREKLIDHLLDRHGTGRVLFRNTRATIKGFPQRQLKAYPLPMPDAYVNSQAHSATTQQLLSPEQAYRAVEDNGKQAWFDFDPRLPWLCEQLTSLKPNKVLIITAAAETACDIAQYLNAKTVTRAALFHENLNIIERDRAAAYFADTEYGCQVLVCSEIGSEGRNFQFAHHLILFDLPLNPDLLEQRIGRLDRIGQSQTITLHVPYLRNSAQAIMYQWYHQGLDAFEHTCPTGQAVYQHVETDLLNALQHPDNDINALLQNSHAYHTKLKQTLHEGRDQLLEYNSCRPSIANKLKAQAQQLDKTSTLNLFMEKVCDCFGIDYEEHSADCYIIRPGNHMLARLPGLPEDGMTITYSRDIALAYEDIQFLSWEHPLVTAAMAWVVESEQGNTAVTAIKHPQIKPGSLLLECIYVLQAPSSSELQTNRYLPPTTIRVVMDEQGKRYDSALTPGTIRDKQIRVNAETANKVIIAKQAELKSLLQDCENIAQQKTPDLLATAQQKSQQLLTTELERLLALKQINPNVRQEEIDFYQNQLVALDAILADAHVQLDAVRVIVAT